MAKNDDLKQSLLKFALEWDTGMSNHFADYTLEELMERIGWEDIKKEDYPVIKESVKWTKSVVKLVKKVNDLSEKVVEFESADNLTKSNWYYDKAQAVNKELLKLTGPKLYKFLDSNKYLS